MTFQYHFHNLLFPHSVAHLFIRMILVRLLFIQKKPCGHHNHFGFEWVNNSYSLLYGVFLIITLRKKIMILIDQVNKKD
jgi:hypothetical protein